jgi:hypothetical protein
MLGEPSHIMEAGEEQANVVLVGTSKEASDKKYIL